VRSSGLALVMGLLVTSLAVPHPKAAAQLTPEKRAELVLSLLPTPARADATVVLRDGANEVLYREGGGRFLCISDASSATRLSMVCHHHELEERLRLGRDLSRETELGGAAFRERLCDEAAARDVVVPNGTMEISASLARDSEGSYATEMTSYHLLYLPDGTEETVGVTEEDPGDGGPWLHNAGTCDAHVMWAVVVTVP